MDPLSQVIRLAMPRSVTVGATDVGGELAIRFPAHDGAFFYSVAFGACWLRVDGVQEPTLLGPGDCVVLPSGRPFTLASDLRLAPVAAATLFDDLPNGTISHWNGGGDCMIFAAHFDFEPSFTRHLLGALDPIVRIHEPAARTAMRSAIEQMIEELQQALPGCEAVVEHLAHIALVKVLRFHLAEVAHERAGWLFALADRRMSAVLAAMQGDPSRRWTVASLAEVASLSRTSFATRFKATVGTSPLDYLTRLRMLLAAKRLAEPGARVSTVGLALGYESESAFCTAFKRVMGHAPRHRGGRPGPRVAVEG